MESNLLLGNEKIIDTLIRYGAHINTASKLGATPLFVAALKGN